MSIQNQIIDACDEIILSNFVTKVNNAKCLTVLAADTFEIF